MLEDAFTYVIGVLGTTHYDKEDTLYVERIEPDGRVTVLRSETYFQRDTSDQVLISNIEDFFVMSIAMFATRKVQPRGSNSVTLRLVF